MADIYILVKFWDAMENSMNEQNRVIKAYFYSHTNLEHWK